MMWLFQTSKYSPLLGMLSLSFSGATSNELLTAVMFRDWGTFFLQAYGEIVTHSKMTYFRLGVNFKMKQFNLVKQCSILIKLPRKK